MKKILNHKIIIVTGSGRSIGRAIALALAEKGATIVNVGRNYAELNETSHIIESRGGQSIVIKADLTSDKDTEEMVGDVLKKYSHIDVLINNAGMVTDRILPLDQRAITEIPTDKFDALISANLKTTFICCREVGKVMRRQRFGHIINISSKLAKVPVAGYGPYSSAKAGVEMITKILSVELKQFNVFVNALSPGESIEIKEREYGLNEKRGQPDQIINPLVKLCVTKKTGQSIVVKI